MSNTRSCSYSHYIKQFEWAKEEAENLLIPLDERIFRRRPSANAWCVGECFSHLIETGNLYYQKVEEGIDRTAKPADASKDPMHLRFHMQWFVNYLQPPVSIKTKAPGLFQPKSYADLDKEEILDDFLNLQDDYVAQLKIAESNKLNLGNIKVPNPLISLIKMTVAECVAVTEAHQRRHMEQARNLCKLIT